MYKKKEGQSLENYRITISKLLWVKSNADETSVSYDKKLFWLLKKNKHCNW